MADLVLLNSVVIIMWNVNKSLLFRDKLLSTKCCYI